MVSLNGDRFELAISTIKQRWLSSVNFFKRIKKDLVDSLTLYYFKANKRKGLGLHFVAATLFMPPFLKADLII